MGAREMCYSQRMPSAKGKIARTLDPVDLAAERRARAAYPWRWQPGQSGNPGGISRFYYESRRIFREASPEAAQALVDLALHAEDAGPLDLLGRCPRPVRGQADRLRPGAGRDAAELGSGRADGRGAREPKGVPRQDGPERKAVGAASGVSVRN